MEEYGMGLILQPSDENQPRKTLRRKIAIEDIWLVYEGGEKDGRNDPNGKAVVLVKIDGRYRRVIEEGIDGPFSHCVHAGGIADAPIDTVYNTTES